MLISRKPLSFLRRTPYSKVIPKRKRVPHPADRWAYGSSRKWRSVVLPVKNGVGNGDARGWPSKACLKSHTPVTSKPQHGGPGQRLDNSYPTELIIKYCHKDESNGRIRSTGARAKVAGLAAGGDRTRLDTPHQPTMRLKRFSSSLSEKWIHVGRPCGQWEGLAH